MIGVVAAVVEAYGEFRVNKLRVLLSLVGVAVSVFAMTVAVGAGTMLSSATAQSMERGMGRATTITVSANNPASGAGLDRYVFAEFDRLGIRYRSRMTNTQSRVQGRSGVVPVQLNAVDPDYAEIFRLRPEAGRWLADNDGRRLVPAVVLGRKTYDKVGRPSIGDGAVRFYPAGASTPVTATVVGVIPDPNPFPDDPTLTAFVAPGALAALTGTDQPVDGGGTQYLAWVPPDMAHQVVQRLRTRLASTPGGSFEVMDPPPSTDESIDTLQKATLAAGGALLLLGALSLVNISLVTVRHRMREIGIRRSYGATSGRIFVGVMLESVVATTIAGVVGVSAAVALVNSEQVQSFFRDGGLVDAPPFPASAVLVGLGSAIGVGVLAGAVPALIATRIKVIDAIRA